MKGANAMFCKNVLLAYDGTEGADNALEKVIALAKQNPDFSVHILYVNEPPQTMIGVGDAYIANPEALNPKLDEEVERKLNDAQKELSSLVQNCTMDIIVDETPGRRIINEAKSLNCDLIVIGSRGLGGFKKLLLGSISSFVVNNAEMPVLVVK